MNLGIASDVEYPPRHLHLTRALESILLSVLSALEAEMVFIRNLVGGLLAELEDNIDHDRFKRLLHYSRRLSSFLNRAKLVS
jgi:magnesium transporter